jgi:hypothetical protein
MRPRLALAALLLVHDSIVFCATSSPAAPPGIVIDHLSASAGLYIGSPSIAVLSNGNYLASHDFFGPKSTEHTKAVTAIFNSSDRGQSWTKISEINGQFWATLFVHHGALFIIGTDRHHGNALIRRSLDGGINWTDPSNTHSGLLRDNGQYHCAPVPVIEHAGRLWRPIERRDPPEGWGISYCAGMLSVPADADLLDASNWTFSEFLPGNSNWLSGTFGGWLEGNPVVSTNGQLLDILRVDVSSGTERAALVRVSTNGRSLSFDPEKDFAIFPGGTKKFTIRQDPTSGFYWSLANIVPHPDAAKTKPSRLRNTLALLSSKDLSHWEIRSVLLRHLDSAKHAFQYVDWLFDGSDVIAVSRTAFDDEGGGAHSYHDANFLTFHRFANFRSATAENSIDSR